MMIIRYLSVHVCIANDFKCAMNCIANRFKWGVGRLIMESPVTPLVIPIYHLGMDQVLPNEPPYVFKTRKKVTINYGNPIDISEIVSNLKKRNATEVEARKIITDLLQEELHR